MKTTRTKIEFAKLPKDYAGLCRILTPRPIHDEEEFENVAEITKSLTRPRSQGKGKASASNRTHSKFPVIVGPLR